MDLVQMMNLIQLNFLKKYTDYNIISPTFDYLYIADTLRTIENQKDIDLVIDSSMGGFFALINRLNDYRIAINPCICPNE